MTTFRIGELQVTRVEDFIMPQVPMKSLLPEVSEPAIQSNLHWLAPRFYDAANKTAAVHIQSWLIRTAHHTILVDTCGGNFKPHSYFPEFDMRNGPYLENLRAAGANPEDINFVFCTHLQADYDAFDPRQRSDGKRSRRDATFEDSVLPVVEAKLALMVDGMHPIDDNLMIEPAPGHSPGHSLLRVESCGESAMFIGDIVHHPLQIAVPDYNSFACMDASLARQTRKRILEACCERNHLVVPAHFAAPHHGRVSYNGSDFAFHPSIHG